MDAKCKIVRANNTGKKIVLKDDKWRKTNDIFVSNKILMNNSANPSNTAK